MLQELRIKDFILIKETTVSFGPQLNVISGETGAGKSIILQALEIVLGGRARPGLVREGTERCEIEALFSLENVPAELREELTELLEGEQVVVARQFSKQGRGKAFINGRLATVGMLGELSSKLLSICGQNDQLKLLQPEYHLQLLDNYSECSAELADYESCFQKWKELKVRVSQLEERQRASVLRRAELEGVIEALSEVPLRSGIRAELEAEIKQHTEREKMQQSLSDAESLLLSDSGVFSTLMQLGKVLEKLSEFSPRLSEASEYLHNAEAELEELQRELNSVADSTDSDTERLEEARRELSSLAQLERRFITNDAGLVDLQNQTQQELDLLDDVSNLPALRKELDTHLAEVVKAGEILSKKRKTSSRKLVKEVQTELSDLNMPQAKLKIDFKALEIPSARGVDRVELLISTNGGKAFSALKGVASGGELSRIMLVLKQILQDNSGVQVLVFDEVDSGISGKVARAVGEKLKKLAASTQVVCITHLAQVASLAEHHFLVDKHLKPQPFSEIRALSLDQRVEEIARMLAGYTITPAARESARELLSSNSPV